MTEEEKPQEKSKGSFLGTLTRRNSKICDDRAKAIHRTAVLQFRRAAEDIFAKIEDLKADLDNMLDLSPVHADSLTLASDFNAIEFANKRIKLGTDLRNERIRFEIAKDQYEELFGETLNVEIA